MRRAPGSKPVAGVAELTLEDWLNHLLQGGFHHPVSHRWNPQRTLGLAAGLIDPLAPGRPRLITTFLKLLVQTLQLPIEAAPMRTVSTRNLSGMASREIGSPFR